MKMRLGDTVYWQKEMRLEMLYWMTVNFFEIGVPQKRQRVEMKMPDRRYSNLKQLKTRVRNLRKEVDQLEQIIDRIERGLK